MLIGLSGKTKALCVYNTYKIDILLHVFCLGFGLHALYQFPMLIRLSGKTKALCVYNTYEIDILLHVFCLGFGFLFFMQPSCNNCLKFC